MAYCVRSDVEGRLRGPSLDADSTPSATDADEMIEGIDAEINTALASKGVTVPVTAPADFLDWLKELCIVGSAASVLMAKHADDKGLNSNAAAGRLEKRYQNGLKRLWSGEAIPSGLTQDNSSLPSSFTVKHPDTQPDLGSLRGSAFESDWDL